MAAKPYQCGLVVGKFSPLHKGHEYLIETAQQNCEHVLIITYSRPEFPSCSAVIRESWLQRRFPQATIFSVDAATVEQWRADGLWQFPMPYNSDSDDAHRTFTEALLSSKLELSVDAVFSSESYGEGFAAFLSRSDSYVGDSVQHVCVDLNRETVTVSGSMLRSRINSSTNLIDDRIAREANVRKVCFLGAESTGKTTLSGLLSQRYGEPWVQEYGREHWERHNGMLTPHDLTEICRVHTRNEDIAQTKAKTFLFCDTSPLTTLSYSEALFGDRSSVIEVFSERPYHQVFLCCPDFPLVQDGTRKGEDFRVWQHRWYLAELEKRDIPFVTLSGSLRERIERIQTILET